MKRTILFAVLCLSLLCPSWAIAQTSLKPELMVPRVHNSSNGKISESTVALVRKCFVKALGVADAFVIVDAEVEERCRDYYNKKTFYVEDAIYLTSKLGVPYVLLVWVSDVYKSNDIDIIATINHVVDRDDYRRAEIKTTANSQDIANACKQLVDKLCGPMCKVNYAIKVVNGEPQIEQYPNQGSLDVAEGKAYVRVDEMPTFLGGSFLDFQQWVAARVQYPENARVNGITGRVVLSYIVETDGSISTIELVGTPDKSLADEVIRVMKLAPKWQPGKNGGKTVRVKCWIPIVFGDNK